MGEEFNIKQCFCRDDDTCPPKGTIDLYRCGGIPMIASLPHFYLADPKLVEDIESGISPVKEKHEIAMLFELVSTNIDLVVCCFIVKYFPDYSSDDRNSIDGSQTITVQYGS